MYLSFGKRTLRYERYRLTGIRNNVLQGAKGIIYVVDGTAPEKLPQGKCIIERSLQISFIIFSKSNIGNILI